MHHQTISLKKSLLQFLVTEMKLPAQPLEIKVCLFRQQGIRERIGNEGREDLYLTKPFIMKTKRNIFIK